MSSGECLIAKVDSILPISGKDFIAVAQISSYSVIVGIDTKVNDIGLLFDNECQLSMDFAIANNLIRIKNLDGSHQGGYFETKEFISRSGVVYQTGLRVCALKFAGVRSEAFWIPISSLHYIDTNASLKIGTQFNEYLGNPICNKYYNPRTKSARSSSQKQGLPSRTTKFRVPMFKEHVDTEQLVRSLHRLESGDKILITEKLHGTSHRRCHGLIYKKISKYKFVTNLWDKIIVKLFKKKKLQSSLIRLDNWVSKTAYREASSWQVVDGTRHTVTQDRTGESSYYGSHDFRYEAMNNLTPYTNETWYGEIVGFSAIDSPIMGVHHPANLKDKSISKIYPENMTYSYGQKNGECKFFVYRITQTEDDSSITELSWEQICERAKNYNIDTVPYIDSFIYDGDSKGLLEYCNKLINGSGMEAIPSSLDNSHVMEGIVVRVDKPNNTTVYLKIKGFVFKVMEGIQKEQDDFLDLEESDFGESNELV